MTIPKLEKILYVEDEPDIQAITKLALENIGGFNLEICNSGIEALEKGPQFGPQLVLMDVMMPGMDGPTTMQELRKLEAFKNIPIIFMTAKVQPQEIAQFKSLGAADVIPKPFDPMTLSDSIQAIWSLLFIT